MKTTIRPRPALAIAGAILSLAMIACTSQDKEVAGPPTATIGNTIDDAVISTEVKAALLADQDVKGLGISVETRKGLVQLRGFADTPARIERVVQLARAVAGVQDIDNGIHLRDAKQSIGTKIDDSVLTVRVQSALLADPVIDSADIKVATSDGKVQLSGFVSSQAKIDQAIKLAGAVEGATSVRNEMTIKH